jgi:hypothetical protein
MFLLKNLFINVDFFLDLIELVHLIYKRMFRIILKKIKEKLIKTLNSRLRNYDMIYVNIIKQSSYIYRFIIDHCINNEI